MRRSPLVVAVLLLALPLEGCTAAGAALVIALHDPAYSADPVSADPRPRTTADRPPPFELRER